MLEIPSIFIPEDWSFTFYEGINRHPDSIFKDKTVCELGCGNGWISIALAEKWLPLKVRSIFFYNLKIGFFNYQCHYDMAVIFVMFLMSGKLRNPSPLKTLATWRVRLGDKAAEVNYI